MILTIVTNIAKSSYDVYIGRGQGNHHILNTPIGNEGWLGNPYAVGDVYTREKAIAVYKEVFLKRVKEDPAFATAVKRLEGKRLGCFCAPKPCRGDVIADWVNYGSKQYGS